MKKRILATLAVVSTTAGLLGQQIEPVWMQTITQNPGAHDIGPGDPERLPILRDFAGEGGEDAVTTGTIDSYAGLFRYDEQRLLLGIRANGINEDDEALPDAEREFAEKFPDRSLIWIDAFTGAPLTPAGADSPVALVIGYSPDIDISLGAGSVDLRVDSAQVPKYADDPESPYLFTAGWLSAFGGDDLTPDSTEEEINTVLEAAGPNSSGGFYWQWTIDENPTRHEAAIYSGWSNKVLRFAPTGDAENPSWSSTATVAYNADTPGRGSGAENGDRWQQWRIINLHTKGFGEDTQIMIHGETWRCCVHPQWLVTKDGLRFSKAVYADADWPAQTGTELLKAGPRVNNRSGGNINGLSSGGGPTRTLTYGLDPNAPELQVVYNGHYPNGNWNSGKTRYDYDPESPFIHGGTGLLDVPMLDGNNSARGNLPAWSYEQNTGNAGNAASNNDFYEGYWNMELEGHDSLDYLVGFSTPSWNNQHGGAYKAGWVGVHQLDGSISKAASNAVKIEVFDWQEAEPGGGAPGAHNASFLNTSAVLNVNADQDVAGAAEVLWTNGNNGFGVARITSDPIGGDSVFVSGAVEGGEPTEGTLQVGVGEPFSLTVGGFTGSPITILVQGRRGHPWCGHPDKRVR